MFYSNDQFTSMMLDLEANGVDRLDAYMQVRQQERKDEIEYQQYLDSTYEAYAEAA